MEIKIKNRRFKVQWEGVVFPSSTGYEVMSFSLISVWVCWPVKSFVLTLFNFSFSTWNCKNELK